MLDSVKRDRPDRKYARRILFARIFHPFRWRKARLRTIELVLRNLEETSQGPIALAFELLPGAPETAASPRSPVLPFPIDPA